MRNAGAAKRQAREVPPEPEPDPAAELMRLAGETATVLASMRGRDEAIGRAVALLEKASARCGDPRLADLAALIATQQRLLVIETISCAAHTAEARAAAERYAETVRFGRLMAEADEMVAGVLADREPQAPARPPGARHAARRRHLASVPGIPTAVTRAAAAGIVAAGLGGSLVAGMHEESFRHVAVPAARVAWHPMAPDQAAVIPQPWSSPSPRPSVAAASARPAPVVTPGAPVFSSPPVSPQPVFASPPPAPVPALDVPRVLDLGDSTRGLLPLAATGQDGVTWTARTTDGITLSAYAGTLVQGQPVTLQVADPAGGAGWVYISAGPETFAVHVTSSLGAPVVALP